MDKKKVIKRKVIQIGNSIGITVDRAFLKEADLSPGDPVEIKLSKPKGTLLVRKIKKRKATRSPQPTQKKTASPAWYI
jgi:antitoxin component of MazEF toxin-antitoxin module